MREDPEYARQALRAGARSYVLKEAEPEELLQAFRMAVAGGNYLHPRLGALIAAGRGPTTQMTLALSAREQEVVRLIAAGYTNAEIAESAAGRRAHGQDLPRTCDREARLLLARGDNRLRRRLGSDRVGAGQPSEGAVLGGRCLGARGRPARGTARRTTVPEPGAGRELELAAHELRTLAHARHPESALQAIAARAEPRSVGKALAVVGHRRA